MADQLSLRLEADRLPELPVLRPMLPRPLPDPFDSAAHLFEPWWGGERALVSLGPAELPGTGAVRIVDAAGVDRTTSLPELSGLAVRVAARSAILDGELVVVDAAGRADAAGLARRLSGAPGRPVAFLAFDLLVLDGRSLLSQPLDKRREALRRVLRPGDEVLAVPAIATDGIALFEAAVAQGIAGVLARQRSSPYLPGVRSRLWRYVAARPGAGGPGLGAADAVQGSEVESEPVGSGAAPVLALISRLPLDVE
jgi:bifunctional non-homologous end joining protein LigD